MTLREAPAGDAGSILFVSVPEPAGQDLMVVLLSVLVAGRGWRPS